MVFEILQSLGILGVTEDIVTQAALSAGIIVASVIVAHVLYWLFERQMLRLAAKTKSELDDKILHLVKKPLYYVVILIGVNVGLGVFLSGTNFEGYVATFVSVLVIAIATYTAARLAKLAIEDFGHHLTAKTETTLDDEALPFISKITNLLIYLVGVMIVINQLGYSITPLVASLGIAGFAIGFAAQDSISNILAGFFILVDRPFKIGDRVKIGGNLGEVIDIGLRTTKVKTLDHLVVIIPNKNIVAGDVINYTLPDMQLKVYLDVGVAYGTDIQKVKDICLAIAQEDDLVLEDPAPNIYFLQFGDSSLNFKLIIWVANFKDKWSATDRINSKIYAAFDREGIEIPFPQRDIHIRDGNA